MYEAAQIEDKGMARVARRLQRKQPYAGFRRLALLLTLVAIALIGMCGIWMWRRERQSLQWHLAGMERAVAGVLDELAAAKAGTVLPGLVKGRKVVARWRSDLKPYTQMDTAQADRIVRLYEVDDKLTRWNSIMDPERVDGVLPLDERWEAVTEEIGAERRRWPAAKETHAVTVPPGLSTLFDGVRDGAAWPYDMVRRAIGVLGISRTGADLAPPVFLRYVVFPYRAGDIKLAWLFGFGAAALLMGYALCWVGMRWRSTALSLTGVAYLFYAVVFAVMLGSLLKGLLA